MNARKPDWTVRGWIYLTGALAFALVGLTWTLHSPLVWGIIARILALLTALGFLRMAYYAWRKHETPPRLRLGRRRSH